VGSRNFPVEIEFNDLLSVAGIEKILSSGTQTVAIDCPSKMMLLLTLKSFKYRYLTFTKQPCRNGLFE